MKGPGDVEQDQVVIESIGPTYPGNDRPTLPVPPFPDALPDPRYQTNLVISRRVVGPMGQKEQGRKNPL